MNILSSPKPLFASLCAAFMDSFKSLADLTILMPFPPPPAAALINKGYPMSFTFLGFVVIGRVGTPDFSAKSLAFNLSPIEAITLAEGPTQSNPAFKTALQNLAFSDKNP